MKQCCRCKNWKELGCFGKSRQTSDGLEPRCKECRSRESKERSSRPEEKQKRAERWLHYKAANPEKIKASAKKYNAMSKYKAARREISKAWEKSESGKAWRSEWRAKNRDKIQAHWAVAYAVRTGRLTRALACQGCGVAGKTEAHHHKGYAPECRLDVQWLCPKCHSAANPQ